MSAQLTLKSTMVMNASTLAAPGMSRPMSKPRLWTAFVAWLAAMVMGQAVVFASFIAVGLGIGIVMGAQGMDPATIQARIQTMLQQPLPALLLSLLPFQMGMLAVVLLAARWSKEPLKQRLGLMPQSGRMFGGFSLITMGAFTLSLALASLVGTTLLLGKAPVSPAGQVATDSSWWIVTLVGILLSLVPAMIEEIVFRGHLQRRLLERWSPAVATGVSTLLFAIMHADSLQHIIAVVPLGLVTGMLAHRTKSIMPGMLVHGVHNAGTMAFAALVRLLMPLAGEQNTGLLIIGLIVALGVIGLPAIISLLQGARSPGMAEPRMIPQPA